MRSDSARISSSSVETSSIGMSRVAHAHQLAVDEVDRTDIDAPGWVLGDHQRRRAGEFAPHDLELLLVAAGHGRGPGRRPADHYAIALDQRTGKPRHGRAVEKSAARKGPAVVAPGIGVFGDGGAERQADALAILGDVAHPDPPPPLDIERLDADAAKRRCPTPAASKPVSALHDLAWPLPLTPAMPTISPARTESVIMGRRPCHGRPP